MQVYPESIGIIPEDPFGVTPADQRLENFQDTILHLRNELYNLLSKLKESQPFHSPRYLGHMNADILMPAVLGYFATMLYNPNNVAYEGSPATTGFELQVGQDLARMMGYDPDKAWGHITSGGTIANFEGLWVSRNLKYFPIAAKRVVKRLKLDVQVTLASGKVHSLGKVEDSVLIMAISPDEALNLKTSIRIGVRS